MYYHEAADTFDKFHEKHDKFDRKFEGKDLPFAVVDWVVADTKGVQGV